MRSLSALIPFHIRPSDESPLKERCYTLWRSIWGDTFAELEVHKKISADDFLDRHIYGLRTESNEICGFMLIRSFTTNTYTLEHSYFDNYPQELKRDLALLNEKVLVISYMTIAPEWRKQNTTLPISEILMGLCVLHFLNSDAKKLLGYFRNNRKTQDIFYRHGGIPIIKDSVAYNVLVDISYIDMQSAHLSTFIECKIETLNFWNQINKGESNDRTNEQQQIVPPTERTI